MGMPLLVSVVDDDESVRESLPDLIKEFGFAVQAFASAQEYLASDYLELTRCLILDVAMPGMSGPDLLKELWRREYRIPVIFITALGDASEQAQLRHYGAVECLIKPFSEAQLLKALSAALPLD
ncbi:MULTISPECIES: response regulator [Pseudomonas]|uniref:Response regulator receiver domain protein n=1 Tax=Pseudomonas fluorescens (strain Q2-87) TaxID=1038922 RepID=J2MP04_PSEFQ|nr:MULTISPECIES: response regulator [Pseudomonas]EJL02647.1 response regulator receiver domain protein [Pseudomonas fluorescens Q2-87]